MKRTIARKTASAVGFGVVVIALLLALAGVFHRKVDHAPPAGRDRVAPKTADLRPVGDTRLEAVRTIRIPATESAVGTIRAVHETSLASKLLAKVMEVNVKAGQPIRQDDILVRLDDADLKARLQQAVAAADSTRARRDQAKIEFDRTKRLFDQGAAAKIEFDRADTALKSAEGDLQQADEVRREAETILGYATIRSPNNGVVIDKKVEVGDMVTPGQPLLTLYDPTRMQLVARVRESLTRRLAIDQAVDVRVESLGKTCQGRVSEIVPEAESASRTFSVKLTGPCPEGIYTGMFGRLLIPLDEEEILAVPRSAIRRIGQLDVVDVAEGDFLRRRTVQLGRALDPPNERLVEVLSGLRPGEKVAVPQSIEDREATAS